MAEKMTLSRALRYKKRVVETIRQFETDVQLNNSKAEGEERETDVSQALKKRASWVAHLVELKLKVQEATRPIQKKVFELAEAKSEISFLQKLDVTHGTVRSRYRDESTLKMEAAIRKPQRDAMVAALQSRIDALQTEIDAFNAEHLIEITAPDLP